MVAWPANSAIIWLTPGRVVLSAKTNMGFQASGTSTNEVGAAFYKCSNRGLSPRVDWSPIKAAMEMMGRGVGTVRGPMRPLTDAQKKTLRKELEILGAFDGSEPMGW